LIASTSQVVFFASRPWGMLPDAAPSVKPSGNRIEANLPTLKAPRDQATHSTPPRYRTILPVR
jgi:hypothetical protein